MNANQKEPGQSRMSYIRAGSFELNIFAIIYAKALSKKIII